MKLLTIALITIALLGSVNAFEIKKCETRTKYCPRILWPVCGFDAEGNQIKTYDNYCLACADQEVQEVKEGECVQEQEQEQFEQENEEFVFCTPEQKGAEICTLEYWPVCAYTEDGQTETFPNICTACAPYENIKYKEGPCEGEEGEDFGLEQTEEFNTDDYFIDDTGAWDNEPQPYGEDGITPDSGDDVIEPQGFYPGQQIPIDIVECINISAVSDQCPKDYNPVCGTDVNGQSKTYGNTCVACSHEDVLTITFGEC